MIYQFVTVDLSTLSGLITTIMIACLVYYSIVFSALSLLSSFALVLGSGYTSWGSFLFALYEILNFVAIICHVRAVFGNPGTTTNYVSVSLRLIVSQSINSTAVICPTAYSFGALNQYVLIVLSHSTSCSTENQYLSRQNCLRLECGNS